MRRRHAGGYAVNVGKTMPFFTTHFPGNGKTTISGDVRDGL